MTGVDDGGVSWCIQTHPFLQNCLSVFSLSSRVCHIVVAAGEIWEAGVAKLNAVKNKSVKKMKAKCDIFEQLTIL